MDTATRLDLERCQRGACCEDCHRPLGWDDAHPWQLDDGYGTVDVVCDSCKEERECNASEAAYERSVEAYYGGSGPQTEDERVAAARVVRHG